MNIPNLRSRGDRAVSVVFVWLALFFGAGTGINAANLTFTVGTTNGVTNAFVVVPIRASQFTDISSFQFSLHWNTNIASFVGVEQFGLPGLAANNDSFGTTLTSTGTLTVLWIDPLGAPATIPNETTIFGVRLRLIGPAAAATSVTIDGTPTAIVAGDQAGAAVPVTTVNGTLNIDRTLIVTCPASKTVECGSAWTFDPPTATDSCGGLPVTINVMSTVTNAGPCGFTATRTWEILDPCLNRTTCVQVVTAVDTTAPVVTCAPNKTVECGSAWTFNAPTATDNCSGSAVTINTVSTVTNATGSCGYTATRTWEVLDPCNNRSTCVQVVTVVDTTAPVVTCAPNKTVECGSAWSFNAPTATDNCVGPNVTINVISTVTNTTGACGSVATRTWEILDPCNNRSTCVQVVTVADTTAPVATCAPNKTVECGSVWSFNAPTATDNCSTVTINTVSTVTNATGSCGYTATRTWELLDTCNNRSTCVQVVTVVDTTAPVATCAPNKTVECGSAWSFNAPTATDNCVGANVTINVMSTVTNAGPCGFTATRTWEILDPCLNRTTCVQVVTAVDTTAPVVTCAPNKTVECGSAWTFNAPTATDNCSGSAVTINTVSTVTNATGSCGYTATRTWEVLDPCNNRSTCVQVVTVVDTTAPVVTCAPNKTVECGSAWSFNAPTATDNCVGPNVTINVISTVTNTTGACGSVATRTWEILDPCNNRSTCVQVVTVADTTAPVATCAPNKTVECGSVWSFNAPTATDNCSTVTINTVSTVTNATGSCGYTATRTWELLDTCNNRSTCVQVVTVVDTTAPVATCAPNKTVECGSAWSFNAPTATDNCVGANVTINVMSTVTNISSTCGYTATRNWEILDPCGNRSTCVQVVTVVDTAPPVATCAPNKTVEFNQAWNFDAPTGTDICVGAGVTIRIVSTTTNTSGFCGPTYSASRIWEIADGCSNKVNCTQTVTIRDTTAPVITCASDKAVNCLSAWTFDTPTAIDVASGASATITVVNTVTNGTCGSGFTATRTWRATDSCGNSATCSQTVSGRAIVSVGGTVYSPTNYPPTITDKRVAGATLLGPTNTTATTAADGSYSVVFDAASNVVITPLAPTGGNPAAGVSTLGLSLVRRHILSVSNLNSPYKLLASDVDGDSAISALDLSLMRRLILGTTNRFPAGLWRFAPANFAFPNVLSPWNAPTNRTYGGVASDLSAQDFVAIKLGDVNNAWTPLAGLAGFESAKDGSLVVSFKVNSATNLPGSSVVVLVTVSDFSEVTSVQGTLGWDPAVVRFAGTEGYGLNGLGLNNFGTNQASTGKLVFSWDDTTAQGVTAPDGTTMFAVRFDVIGELGIISPVALLDSIAVREVGVNFAAATFHAVDGQVAIMEPPAPRLSQVAFTQGTFAVTVLTVSDKRYFLEYTDNLPATNWTALPLVLGNGRINILSDPAPSPEKRFYRVRVE